MDNDRDPEEPGGTERREAGIAAFTEYDIRIDLEDDPQGMDSSPKSLKEIEEILNGEVLSHLPGKAPDECNIVFKQHLSIIRVGRKIIQLRVEITLCRKFVNSLGDGDKRIEVASGASSHQHNFNVRIF